MGYNGQGLDKRSQGIVYYIVIEQRPKHEGLGFSGKDKVSDYNSSQARTTKITFVKARGIEEEDILIEEKVDENGVGTNHSNMLVES